MPTRMQQRRSPASTWTSTNPVLAAGEIGFELDTNKFKIGDGTKTWTQLSYFTSIDDLQAVIDNAPDLLNTLNELAAAIGDDPNFVTTINSAIAAAEQAAKDYADANFVNIDDLPGQLGDYIPLTQKGNVDGVATLDSTGNVPFSQLGNIIDGAPGVLDTLNEISAAINDDASFVTTITNTISNSEQAAKDYADDAVFAHREVTTFVHGIEDTSILVTTPIMEGYIDGYVPGEISNAINEHNGTTVNVHGIANITELETLSGAQAKADAARDYAISSSEAALLEHSNISTNIHGIANVADLATKLYADTATTNHANTSLNVHGIANTADLATKSYADNAAETYTDSALGAHEATTLNVHGIANTANLADKDYVATEISDHKAVTLNVHGISDTAELATKTYTNDAVSTHNLDTTGVHGIADTSALETQTGAQNKATAAETNAKSYADGIVNSLTTDDVPETITTQYFTNERAQDAVGLNVGDGLVYDDVSGSVSVLPGTGLQTDSANGTVEIDSTVTTNDGIQTLTNKTIDQAILTGDTVITSTTESTSTTSGALVVGGGIGLGGNLEAGGTAYFGSPTTLNLTNPVAFFTKDVDDYIQVGIQNKNNGPSASGDLVITADNGTNSTHYVDLGIASSGYDYPDFGAIQPNDAYLIVEGGDLIINASTGGKAIDFYVGGTLETDEVGTWNETSLTVLNNLNVNGATDISSTLNVDGQITANDLDVTSHVNLTPIAGASAPTWAEGNLYYDSEEKTVILQGAGSGNFEMSMGQREWVRTRNSTGSTIPKGTPVYVTGVHIPGDPTHGHHPTIAPADASDPAKHDVIGITGEAIAAGAHGYTVVRGYIEGVDTSSLTSGAKVYLSADIAGGITDVSPGYPNYPILVGICLTSDSTNGTLYVDIASQSVEQLRVDNDLYVDGNFTVAGDLTILGSQSNVSVANLNVDNNFIYLNNGDSIGAANTVFSGTGVGDARIGGRYEGAITKTFKVKITINGSGTDPDSFRWSTDNFATDNGTDIQIVAGQQFNLSDGLYVSFVSDNGHDLNDTWTGTAAPVAVDIAFVGNRNTGSTGPGYTHLGMFYDVSDDKFKFFSEYAPEPDGSIDPTDASFTYGIVKASTFEGNLVGNVTGSISGNAGTVTNGVYTTDTATVTNVMLAGSIADSKLSTISTAGKVSNSATTATEANTANAIVARDASGNFTAGIISASLDGNAATATSATNATNAAKVGVTQDNVTDGIKYLTWVDATSGNNIVKATSSLSFNPFTGNLIANTFEGNLDGTALSVINGVYTTDTGTVTNTMLAGSIAQSKIVNLTSDLSAKAPKASPSFTGGVTIDSSGIIFTDGTQVKQGVPSITSINQQTGAYTSVLTDRDKLVEINSASGVTLTIPTDASVAYPVGTSFDILQTGTGQVTIAGASGVTVNATPGLKLRTQWSSATLFKRATDTWVVFGDLTA